MEYQVCVSQLVTCTCPDSSKGNQCKHIFFVLLKVLRIDKHSPLLFQKALLTSELATLFAQAPRHSGASVYAQNQMLREHQSFSPPLSNEQVERVVQPVRLALDASHALCAICFDEMTQQEFNNKALQWCQNCGHNLHAACIARWLEQAETTAVPQQCPLCRSPWQAGSQ